MGSLLGGKTKSTTTQNQTWGPTQYVADAYKGLIGQAQGVAKTPYNPATAQKVAGFTQPQYQGFAGVRNNQGSYQPYMDQAAGLATLGSSAITGDQIAGYMNPYTDQVIDASMNDWARMADRRMTDVNSNASKIGALTGDRSQVAQALAREASDNEMASGIANLRNQGWQSALGAAQNDAGRALEGAQIQGSLGGLAQQYGYNDAQALLGIGGMQQDQQQKVLDANTLNAKTKSAYPFETTQWLANILQGIGSQAGGTSEGTGTSTQKSGGNWLGKIIGTAATLYGMSDERVKRDIQEIGATHDGQPIYSYRFAGSPKTEIGLMAQEVEQRHPEAVAEIGGLKHVNYAAATRDAARPTYADGGEVGGLRNISYVPVSGMRPGQGMQPPQMATPQPQQGGGGGDGGMSSLLDSFQQAKSAMGGEGGGSSGGGIFGKMFRTSTDPASGWSTTVNPSSASGWGNYFSNSGGLGGLASGISSGLSGLASGIGGMFGFANGGMVPAYADGGEVYDPFVQFGQTSAEAPQRPMQAGLAPLAAQPPSPSPTAPAAQPAAYKHVLWDNGLGEDASNALMMAGLGMIAGGGRDAFEDIGRGGLMGLQFYNQAKQQHKTEAQAKAKEAEGKLMEINGKLVRVMPDGSTSVVYDGSTADQGKILEVGGKLIRALPDGRTSVVYDGGRAPDVKEVAGRLVQVGPDGAKVIYEPPQTGALGPYKDAKQLSDVEEGLRKEHTAATKDLTIIRDGLRRVTTGAKLDNGAGDLAVVYGYMKMLDPGSVVREGEFATAEQTTGIPSYVVNLYNKVVSGDRLPPDAREKFALASRKIYDNAAEQYTQTRKFFEDVARRKGLDPANIINDPLSFEPPSGPKEVENPASVPKGEMFSFRGKKLRALGPDETGKPQFEEVQ